MKMTSKYANSFLSPIHKFYSDLDNECYDEGCNFEEVTEVKGHTEEAVILP